MKYVTGAKCLICGKTYDKDGFEYVCPDHENEGILDILYDYDAIKNKFTKQSLAKNPDLTLWRYKPLLPINEDCAVPGLHLGMTPLYCEKDQARQLKIKDLYIKDDGRLPTASFKDRASAIAVVKAMEKKAKVITTASTGNAAAALSGLCACVDLANVIFVPRSAPRAKIAQLLMFGSKVILVDGSYDDAFDLCMAAAGEYGWYNRNTGFNPYMSEGKKTCAFEICEQLDWKAPDVIFVSVGDGCIIGGIHKGLKDLLAMGWIDKMPRLIGVQAKGSSYMAQAWKNQEDVLTKPGTDARTVADSICAQLPRDRIKAMNAVLKTRGAFITVTDDEIIKAIPDLAGKTGVFAEPAGAAAWAGLKKAARKKMLDSNETVVVINTGNGLKDINTAMKAVELTDTKYYKVKPSIQEFKAIALELKL